MSKFETKRVDIKEFAKMIGDNIKEGRKLKAAIIDTEPAVTDSHLHVSTLSNKIKMKEKLAALSGSSKPKQMKP